MLASHNRQQPCHRVDAAAEPRAGEVVELRIARRRRDVADGEHVRVAEEDVDVAARVRLDQIAVVDALACQRSSSHRRGRSWSDAPPRDAAAGSDLRQESRSAIAIQSRVFSCATIVAPACRSASFAPVFSGCQCVLNTVATRPPGQLLQRSHQWIGELGRAAVDEHEAVGSRERRRHWCRRSSASDSRSFSGDAARSAGAAARRGRQLPCSSVRPSSAADDSTSGAVDGSMHQRACLTLRDEAGAVAERLLLGADLVEDRQVQVGERRRLGRLDVLAALSVPLPPPTRIVGSGWPLCRSLLDMFEPYRNMRVIQQRAVAVVDLGQLVDERGEALDVPGLDLDQLLEPVAGRWRDARPDGRSPTRRCGCRCGWCLRPP